MDAWEGIANEKEKRFSWFSLVFSVSFFLFSFLGKHILCAKVQNAKAKTVFRLQVYETGNGF